MTWACFGHTLPLVYPDAADCRAAGDTDRDAEKHTCATGHPTTSGLHEAGVRWAK